MHNDPILVELSRLIAAPAFGVTVAPILERVEGALEGGDEKPQAWEPVPVTLFGTGLPASIKSCWVFILRRGASFGAERHPNSHQRTVALRGRAVFEIFRDGGWSPHPIDGAGTGSITARWVSIPANTWHRIQIGPENLLSFSFHTVAAHELIEETPVAEDLNVTRQRLYHA